MMAANADSFVAVLLDGSAHVLSLNDAARETLRRLLTYADGQVVDFP